MLEIEAEEFANRVFEGNRYRPSKEEVKRLAGNILLLEQGGLEKLNKRLVEGGRKVWDTLVEHNLAAELVLLHGSSARIAYEPPEENPPPDFKIIKEGLTYWVQVKNLSRLGRENRQIKNFESIRRFGTSVKVGKYLGILLSSEFEENDIQGFQEFIAGLAKKSVDDQEYSFPDENNSKAKVTFWSPQEVKLSHLTLGTSGDMEMVELTGLAKEQIRGSLLKAVAAFKWNVNQTTINLIALDADRHNDIDICDAIFGSEYFVYGRNHQGWNRDKDGLFREQDFSAKVAGVFAIRRKEPGTPISDYHKILYINETFLNHVDNIKNILTFDSIIHFNMRPPMGKGKF
jgi:hypothetical protein